MLKTHLCRRTRLRALVAAVACGVLAPAFLRAENTAPELVSRTGGGAWSNPAELQAAAKQGNPRACAQLGEILLRGGALPQDGPRALTLLESAARAGESTAAFRIGMLLDDGIDVAQDRIRALAYFRAAAAGGETEALHNVGAAYASARGVRRDYAEALGWLILATKKGDKSGAETQLRAHLAARRHPASIAAGERRALAIERELAQRSVISFLPPPAPLIWGSTADPATGPNVATLTQAADRGDADAQVALAQILLDGRYAPEDPARAVSLLERGAKSGDAEAAQRLAELYTQGAKVTRDDATAFAYTLQAARGGAAQAMFNAGALYANGRGTERDFTEALAWLVVAKHYGLDRGQEKRIRDYLVRSHPEQISVAEKRAADRIHEIDTNPHR